MELLLRYLDRCSVNRVKWKSKAIATKARGRANAKGPKSQSRKYVNILAGRRQDKDLEKVRQEVESLGLNARIVPGPFLLSTSGGAHGVLTCMPLQVESASAVSKAMLEKAAMKANCDPRDPDPDLDVDVRDSGTKAWEKAKWTSHSMRRLANTIARRYRGETDTTEAEIDIYLGWHERVLLKQMQRHYEAMDIRARMKQSRITGSM